jgi:hypothetical protein
MKKLILAALILSSVSFAQADRVRGRVIGIGSTSSGPEMLYSRGWDAAIFEARVCRVTGYNSNHSRCYVLYDTGWSEFVSSINSDAIETFIERLEREREGGQL